MKRRAPTGHCRSARSCVRSRSTSPPRGSMLILSALAFFVVIFLLASITVAVAWMGFLKTKAEESDAARRDRETAADGGDAATAAAIDEDSPLFRTERLSTINFLDTLLTRFDFIEIMR